MDEDQKWNELMKFRAATWDRMATNIVTVGIATPLASFFLPTSSAALIENAGWAVSGVIVFAAVGLALHMVGERRTEAMR